MATYNNIISAFEGVANDHTQIASFGYGDIHEVNQKEDLSERLYPIMWVQHESSQIERRVQNDTFRIFVMDLTKLDDEDRELEATSDTHEICRDLIAILSDFEFYDSNMTNVEWNENPITLESFTERFNDGLTGWTFAIQLERPYIKNQCSIPLLSNPACTPPDREECVSICDDVTVEDSLGNVLATVAAGGTYVVPDVTVDDQGTIVSLQPSGSYVCTLLPVAFQQECSFYSSGISSLTTETNYNAVLSSGEYTMIIVFKYLGAGGATENIMGAWNASGNNRSSLLRVQSAGNLQYFVSGNGSTNVNVSTTSTSILTGGWQMLAVRVSISEGNNTDRVRIFDQTGELTLNAPSGTWAVPYNGTADLQWSNGVTGGAGIEDYINRAILLPYAASAAEISDFWNSGSPKASSDAFSSVSFDGNIEDATFTYQPSVNIEGWEVPNFESDGIIGVTKSLGIDSGDRDCNENPYL